MPNWRFFPSAEAVFSGPEQDYFVPLATVELQHFIPDAWGHVHFLRPRMIDGDRTAELQADSGYPANWYPFRRDEQGRYSSIVPLGGILIDEVQDPYQTRYCGNSRERYLAGDLKEDDLLAFADLSGVWPDANWNDGRSAVELTGRELTYIGELDTTNFCAAGSAGSVLVMDREADLIIQVFHWD